MMMIMSSSFITNTPTTTTTTTLLHAHKHYHLNLLHAHKHYHLNKHSSLLLKASTTNPPQDQENDITNGGRRRRSIIMTTVFTTSLVATSCPAMAQNWGVRSFIWERFFEPDLSPEDSVARIKQTAEGLHSMREMLDTMSWRYVIFYIRLKQSYLSKDLKIAMETLPQGRWNQYVDLANDLVENMARLDQYVRTPKVYESYLYYEKTLKSIDNIVAFLV